MNKEMSGFQPKYHDYIEELRADGYYYEHAKTGAELFYLHTKDDNKVFSVGFNTVPTDDTGVAHITEHCVLCGSEKYPLKELFMTLNKSSLNTYLNAMTFSDKTLYPVASQNDQDFMNLIDVYMDGIFHPTMYRDELFFRQEGHGFDFENGEVGLPSGVVYNEMKGAMAAPDSMLSSHADRALFSNTYQYNSGGDPESVLDLKYEDFLAFHKKHYHPSNARFYVYGDADIERICAFLDECISKFDRADAIEEPVHVSYQGEPSYIYDTYQTAEDTAVGTMNFVIGSTYDIENVFVASVLTSYLFEQSASPFKKSLLESGFCTDLYGGVDDTRASATIYLTMYGLKEFDPKKLEERIFDELRKIDREKLSKALKATLHYYGFNLREFDTGSNPRGMIPMYTLLLHTRKMEDPFVRLRFERYLKRVEERIDAGEHLKWIEEFMIDNRHRVSVVLTPQKEDEVRAEGNLRWDALDEEQKTREREWYERLRVQQEAPDSEEALAALPKITLADVPKDKTIRDVQEISLNFDGKERKLLYYKLETGILYVKLFFPIAFESVDDMALFSAAINMLGNTDTQNYTLSELGYEILLNSGGMKCGLEFYDKKSYFYVMLKTLPDKLERNFELVEEILFRTKLSDTKRFSEVLSQAYSRIQLDIISSGNRYAVEEILAGYDVEERNVYYSSGIGFFLWLKEMMSRLGDEDELKKSTARAAAMLRSCVVREGLLFGLGGDEKALALFKQSFASFLSVLPEEDKNSQKSEFWSESSSALLAHKSSAYVIPAEIQFVAIGGMKEKLSGAFYVLKALLGTEYLWPEVRMKGGAYGAGITVNRSGHFVFSSYRDPNLGRTIEAFQNAPAFVGENLEFLETAKLSAIAAFDQPISPRKEALDAFDRYFLGITGVQLQEERRQILDTDAQTIVAAANKVKEILDEGRICVVGGENKIDEDQALFETIKKL